MQIRLLTGKGESMIGQLSVSGCVDTFLAFHKVVPGATYGTIRRNQHHDFLRTPFTIPFLLIEKN